MGIIPSIVLLVIGFVLLMKGADWFVEGSSGIAERFGISQLVIGLTFVAMGTSAPEAAVSITSALKGSAGITIGNVVGSNILNVLIILGITAVITQVPVKTLTMKREIPFTIVITLLLAAFGYFAGQINFVMGLILCAIFIAYLVYLFIMAKSDSYQSDVSAGADNISAVGKSEEAGDTGSEDEEAARPKSTLMLLGGALLGLVGIVLGSDLTVDSASELARIFGMSERFIGLTIVAFGTSLPELVTSVAAALKHKADIAIGNIIGSNIFNALGIVGITALITPVEFESAFVFDTLVAAGAVVILLASLLKTKSLRKPWGVFMLVCYAAYFAFITFR